MNITYFKYIHNKSLRVFKNDFIVIVCELTKS